LLLHHWANRMVEVLCKKWGKFLVYFHERIRAEEGWKMTTRKHLLRDKKNEAKSDDEKRTRVWQKWSFLVKEKYFSTSFLLLIEKYLIWDKISSLREWIDKLFLSVSLFSKECLLTTKLSFLSEERMLNIYKRFSTFCHWLLSPWFLFSPSWNASRIYICKLWMNLREKLNFYDELIFEWFDDHLGELEF
jgi:hypothetical protein